MIPCNCPTCSNSDDKYFYDYNNLLERKEFGRETIECEKRPFAAVKIIELLEGVFARQKSSETANNNNNVTAKRIFISYAHKDEQWKDDLVVNLASLQKRGLISAWNDREIEAGLWDSQIEEAMENADIFMLLVTQHFLASPYIVLERKPITYSISIACALK